MHSSGNKCSLLAAGLIPNDPFQRPEDDFCQLSMPVRAEVPSALHTWDGPCADPLHASHDIVSLTWALPWQKTRTNNVGNAKSYVHCLHNLRT